ncbi:MAG: YdcH family protein [Rhodospirillaceae bacterium]
MSFEDRIESLRLKHQSLEEEVRVESQRPSPDTELLARLKREKLKIKDEIARLSHG